MEEAYISHVYSNASPFEKEYLAHHGILGQKWGVRRFQNKDGTRTAEGKERYKEVTDLEKDLVDMGYQKDTYGYYEKKLKTKDGNDLYINIRKDTHFKEPLSDDAFKRLIGNIENDRDRINEKVKENLLTKLFEDELTVDSMYGHHETWSREQKKNQLKKDLGKEMDFNDKEHSATKPGYIFYDIMGDGLGSVDYTCGWAFGDHILTSDIDWKTKKVGNIGING